MNRHAQGSAMDIRRHAKREDRRRRVLRDEAAVVSRSSPVTRQRKPASASHYPDGAVSKLQPRLTSLIPLRGWSLLVFFLTGLVAIALVLALDAVRMHYLSAAPPEAAACLTLRGPGTLAVWLGSLWLQITALAALIVLSIRRHKVDDYRGTYRRWGWAAAACVVASIDVSTGAHRLLAWAMVELTSFTLWREGAIWWVLVALLTALLVGVPVVLDMWRCRFGLCVLGLACCGYLMAAASQLSWWGPHGWLSHPSLQPAVGLLSHWLLCTSWMINARHVYREAEGRSSAKPKRARRQWLRVFSSGTAREAEKKPRSLAAKTTPARRTRRMSGSNADSSETTKLPSSPSSAEHADAGGEDLEELDLLTNPDLTKAEKRKLRKKLRRGHRQAA